MARRLLAVASASTATLALLTGTVAPASAAPATPSVTYQNCLDVWNHIHRPITKNDPGYSFKLDADKDGIGCENQPAGYVAPKPAQTTRFVDVPNNRLFATEINWVAVQGISTGWPDRTYRPDLSVERGAMAAFFYRMAGSPFYTPPKTSRFKDVPTTHQFYKEISWLASKGITTGYADGTYRPDAVITRDAMAAFFYRMAGSPAYTAPRASQFRDIKPGDQFYKEVAWMASRKITTGWNDGTFRPLASVKRDAMAAFIYRFKH